MADLWELSPGLAVYLLIFAALLGSVWASFSGCAASRMKNGESFLKGRSHCDSCGHVLKPLDLVPIFSWLFAKGRCRYCKAKIPASCPVTEALGAASFVLILWRYGLTLLGARNLIFTAILILISLIDWETGLIPDSLILASLASFLLFTGFISGWHGIWTGLVGGLMLGSSPSASGSADGSGLKAGKHGRRRPEALFRSGALFSLAGAASGRHSVLYHRAFAGASHP